ncbi:TPR repeat family protein [Cryptosporidium meleagridis]|uniref:TPR repeat family protein n=1 Tax=Cryptosporidium meleagridis TaxID=93969 RepID=A0A2P4Z035_9CRYT|nr:TPR repeat family protein [Cryptosporidium meleagridis]
MEDELLSILTYLDRWQLYDNIRFWGEVIDKLLESKVARIQISRFLVKDLNLQEAFNYLRVESDKTKIELSPNEDSINKEVNLYGDYLTIKCCYLMGRIDEAERMILKICSKPLTELADSCLISPSISPKSWKGTPVASEKKKSLSSIFSTICMNPTMLIKYIHTGELKIPGDSAGLYLWGNILEELDAKVSALYCYAIALDWNPVLWKSFQKLVGLSCQYPHELVKICCCLNNWGEKHLEYVGTNSDALVISTVYKNEAECWQVKDIQDGNLLISISDKSDSEELYVLNVSDFFYNVGDTLQKRHMLRYHSFTNWLENPGKDYDSGPKWPYSEFEDVRSASHKFNSSNISEVNYNSIVNTDNIDENIKPLDSRFHSLISMIQLLSKFTHQMEWYLCNSFLKNIESIPSKILEMGYVKELHVRALFESNQWQECINICKCINYETNYNLWIKCLDIYSSCLWQLSRSIDLINLSNLTLKIIEKNTPQLWIVVGNCFSLHKEYESSIKCFKRAIQYDNRYVYAYTLIGHELSIIEKYDEAIQMYQKALKIDPRCHRAHWGIGYVWFKREEYYQAKNHFNLALKVVPNNSTLIHYLGLCYLTTHDFLSAYNTFQKGILKDQRNPWLKYHAGIVLLELERYEEALTMLTAAHRLASNEPNIHLYLGKTFSHLGRKDKALRHLNIAFDLTKDINEKQIILNLMKELENGSSIEGRYCKSNETNRSGRVSNSGAGYSSGSKLLSSFRNHHYFPIRNDPPNPFIHHQIQQEHNIPQTVPSPAISGSHSLLLTLMPGNN